MKTELSAEVVADTEYGGVRLISFRMVYPRFIHSQMMTYRRMARNTASSRAVPTKRAASFSDYIPAKLPKGGSGMGDAVTKVSPLRNALGRLAVRVLRRCTLVVAWFLTKLGVHKQYTNRLLEPFTWCRAIFTARYEDWQHFIEQRTSPNEVQPETFELAELVKQALSVSRPKKKMVHMPWGYSNEDFAKSVARAARISYARELDEPGAKFLKRIGELWREGHKSPFEHVAVVASDLVGYGLHIRPREAVSWVTLRELLDNEQMGLLWAKSTAETYGISGKGLKLGSSAAD